MHRVVAVATGGYCVIAMLLMCGLCLCSPATADGANSLEPPALLTNLFQLRHCAEQKPPVLHPFRIVADVLDADSGSGVLVLRDASDIECIQLDLRGQKVEPGAKVCLEGKGCGVKLQDSGLAIVPGMVVNNDGIHGMQVESGTSFLHAGLNPIELHWFNQRGALGLKLHYEGPGLAYQPIPDSVLSRRSVDPASGATNFSAGLEYRCYEDAWAYLPDFTKYHPVKTGIVTNFDLGVRMRNERVGLEFNGFIKIPRDGTYTFYVASDDGSRLFVGESSLKVRVLGSGRPPPAINHVPISAAERKSRPWVTLEGTADFVGSGARGGELQMQVGNDEVRVEVFNGCDSAPNVAPGATVRVSGIYRDVLTDDGLPEPGMLLAPSWKAVHPVPPAGKIPSPAASDAAATSRSADGIGSEATAITEITTAAGISAFPPGLTERRLPVSIRGVVTAVLPSFIQGVVVQDSTKGIFVSLEDLKDQKPLKRGELYQFDGVTGPGLFAPVIVAHRITHLGVGRLPQPAHATWERLVDGSLDTQYADIEGIVTKVDDQQIVLQTEGGKIALDMNDFQSDELARYENDLVRIRGCVFASFNEQTRELEPGSLRVAGGAVDVLRAAPRDLFDAPKKGIGQLLLYDSKTAPFRLLKVSGQLIYGRAGEYFLTDGTNGVRVISRGSASFTVGDLVDAVGFLQLGGLGAELKEAVLRKTGRAPLPAPITLRPEHLLAARDADTLVRVDATLMNQWHVGSEYVLELQSGFTAFRARLASYDRGFRMPPSGSRLELIGVYAPEGSGLGDSTVSGFELLLNSPSAIRVLAKPAWWTLNRVLILAGILAALLFVVLIWNKELHRLVEERSRQLETEIRSREQAELKHAAEAERARIARDLQDELGAGLTEVSLLASAGLGESQVAQKRKDRFLLIADKARALVSGLDVIVWAIDPRRNSLQSFADYTARFAKEFLSTSNVSCRLVIPIEFDEVTLNGGARHNLFLAVKEALNNVLRHASATEVELQMRQLDNHLEIMIADNGTGFDWNAIQHGDGLANLRERLELLQGRCRIESQPGKGTIIKLRVPLSGNAEWPTDREDSHIQ